MAAEKLSMKTKLGFGIGDVGGNLIFQIMGFWLLNYLTDTVGLSVALAGVALMIGKFWDAITDPLMGIISDRTKSKMGRRRPYLLLGAIVAFVSMIIMFFNPHFPPEEQNAIFIWAVAAYCFLCLAFTIVNIPYSALTPELTTDYNERTSLNGFRMFFALIGTLLGAGAFLPVVMAFTSPETNDKSAGYLVAGIVFGAIIMVVTLITFFSVRENPKAQTHAPKNIFRAYRQAFTNGPYLLILIPWAMNIIGITIISGIMQYYFKYIYQNESLTTIALFILLAVAMGSIFIWVRIIRKIEKKIAYAIGLGIVAMVCLLVFFFARYFDVWFMFVMMGIAGLGLSATYVSPWAIVPDTIEYDYVKTGVRKEGVYYGLWTFISKSGQALAVFLMGQILAAVGYVENVAQTPESIMGIRLLLGPLPFVFLVLGAVVVLFYPINAKKYEELRKQAEAMEKKATV